RRLIGRRDNTLKCGTVIPGDDGCRHSDRGYQERGPPLMQIWPMTPSLRSAIEEPPHQLTSTQPRCTSGCGSWPTSRMSLQAIIPSSGKSQLPRRAIGGRNTAGTPPSLVRRGSPDPAADPTTGLPNDAGLVYLTRSIVPQYGGESTFCCMAKLDEPDDLRSRRRAPGVH